MYPVPVLVLRQAAAEGEIGDPGIGSVENDFSLNEAHKVCSQTQISLGWHQMLAVL